MPSVTPSPPTGRVLAVLDLLAADPEREFTLTEIVDALGIRKATCHAIVTTMVGRGYLVKSSVTKGYVLGPAVVVTGRAAEQANPALLQARAAVPELARELGVECVASIVEHGVITVVEWAAGRGDPGGRRWSHPGQRVPLVPPFGAAHVAWSSDERIGEWLGAAPATADLDELRASLAAIRSRGFDVQVANPRLERFRAALATIELDDLSTTSRAAVSQLMGELGTVEYLPAALAARSTYDVNALATVVFDRSCRPALTLSVHPVAPMRGAAVMKMGRRMCAVADACTCATGGLRPQAR